MITFVSVYFVIIIIIITTTRPAVAKIADRTAYDQMWYVLDGPTLVVC